MIKFFCEKFARALYIDGTVELMFADLFWNITRVAEYFLIQERLSTRVGPKTPENQRFH